MKNKTENKAVKPAENKEAETKKTNSYTFPIDHITVEATSPEEAEKKRGQILKDRKG